MSNSVTKSTMRSLYRFVVQFFVALFAPGSVRRYREELILVQLRHDSRPLIHLILNATTVVVMTLFVLLCISYAALGNTYVLSRIIICLIAIIYVMLIRYLVVKCFFRLAAWMLIGLYVALATIILLLWSINAQIGILTLGFIIILAGVMLGARYIMPVSFGVIILLTILQWCESVGLTHPDRSGLMKPSSFTDVISYGTIFAVFSLVCWISGRQMEQTLKQALAAEAALEQEKQSLSSRLEEQTRNLREAQLAEMRQLYRFAELGQLSTVILHELANHLTVLTLDMDDIEQRHHRSDAVASAKESIAYLDTIVVQARHQLHESSQPRNFDLLDIVKETLDHLEQKATKHGIRIVLNQQTRRKTLPVMGDPLRLSQIMTIIVTNAIEAYQEDRSSPAAVRVDVNATGLIISIRVTDNGRGISSQDRAQLFEPFRTSKKSGMGIGLFIAKEMVDSHFNGEITLDPRTDETTFIISIPEYKKKMHS